MSAELTTILVVEDDVALARLLIILLESEGYQVIGVRSIQAACARLQAPSVDSIDLVLTDSFSVRPDGVFSATASLRQVAGTTPVLLCTAHRVRSKAARAAGFAGLITKPFDIGRLLPIVRDSLHVARCRSETPGAS